jgi:hypothetical protein
MLAVDRTPVATWSAAAAAAGAAGIGDIAATREDGRHEATAGTDTGVAVLALEAELGRPFPADAIADQMTVQDVVTLIEHAAAAPLGPGSGVVAPPRR